VCRKIVIVAANSTLSDVDSNEAKIRERFNHFLLAD